MPSHPWAKIDRGRDEAPDLQLPTFPTSILFPKGRKAPCWRSWNLWELELPPPPLPAPAGPAGQPRLPRPKSSQGHAELRGRLPRPERKTHLEMKASPSLCYWAFAQAPRLLGLHRARLLMNLVSVSLPALATRLHVTKTTLSSDTFRAMPCKARKRQRKRDTKKLVRSPIPGGTKNTMLYGAAFLVRRSVFLSLFLRPFIS